MSFLITYHVKQPCLTRRVHVLAPTRSSKAWPEGAASGLVYSKSFHLPHLNTGVRRGIQIQVSPSPLGVANRGGPRVTPNNVGQDNVPPARPSAGQSPPHSRELWETKLARVGNGRPRVPPYTISTQTAAPFSLIKAIQRKLPIE